MRDRVWFEIFLGMLFFHLIAFIITLFVLTMYPATFHEYNPTTHFLFNNFGFFVGDINEFCFAIALWGTLLFLLRLSFRWVMRRKSLTIQISGISTIFAMTFGLAVSPFNDAYGDFMALVLFKTANVSPNAATYPLWVTFIMSIPNAFLLGLALGFMYVYFITLAEQKKNNEKVFQ